MLFIIASLLVARSPVTNSAKNSKNLKTDYMACSPALADLVKTDPLVASIPISRIDPSLDKFLLKSANVTRKARSEKLRDLTEDECEIYDFINTSANSWIKVSLKYADAVEAGDDNVEFNDLETLDQYRKFLSSKIYPTIVHALIDYSIIHEKVLSNESISSEEWSFYGAMVKHLEFFMTAFNRFLITNKSDDYRAIYHLFYSPWQRDIPIIEKSLPKNYNPNNPKQMEFAYLTGLRNVKVYNLYFFIRKYFDAKHDIPKNLSPIPPNREILVETDGVLEYHYISN